MGNVGFVFGLVSFVLCLKLSARLTKMERLLKLGVDKTKSLYSVLIKNIGKTVTITFCNGDSLFGNKKMTCEILDVDEEWILIKEEKKIEEQLLHIDSICNIQI